MDEADRAAPGAARSVRRSTIALWQVAVGVGALALWESGDVGGAAKKTVVFVTHDLEEAIALADEVVVLSAGPAARVVARHPVPLGRPRDLMELRTAPAFVDLHRALWVVLREEVKRSQRAAEPTRG